MHLATLRSVMGKDCLQIFLNLKLTEEETTSVNASLAAWKPIFSPKTNVEIKQVLGYSQKKTAPLKSATGEIIQD